MAEPLVVAGAMLTCTQGSAPARLNVLPDGQVVAGGQPAARIADHEPMLNIPGFGMCRSLTNPAVAAATSAAQGVLTPQPCVPVIPTPWTPGVPSVLVSGEAGVDKASTCACTWAGTVAVQTPGQLTVLG